MKKFEPNIRSNVSKKSPTVNGGKPNTISIDATSAVHVNNGILMYVIPGALIVIIVVTKLIPVIKVPAPAICKPIA